MTMEWERNYEYLGDVSGTIREAMVTLRKTAPRCTLAGIAPDDPVYKEFDANLAKVMKDLQTALDETEGARKTLYLSHNPKPPPSPLGVTTFPFAPAADPV